MNVRALAVGLAVALLCAACQASNSAAPRMTHGPLAGAVTNVSADIWARTDAPARVRVQYSQDPALAGAQSSAVASTDSSSDFTTIVKITNLAPEQTYFYNVYVDDVPQLAAPYPQFRTFAPPGQAGSFRFVILTDFRTVSRITHNVSTFGHAAAEAPAFVILGGDFDHRNPTSLDAKREMFRDLYTAANGLEDFVQQVLSRFALVHYWDDHDYGDNNADKTYPNKADSLRVLQEYFPLYPISRYGDWQSFSYGDADFFVLDSRSQRDPARDADDAELSMLDGDNLGAAGQREWLLRGLKASRARWKFIVSPVIFNPTTKTNDGWGAYPAERAQLLDFIRDNGISGVIVLSGDLHIGAIDDGTNSELPELVTPTANDGFEKRCLTEPSGEVGRWSVGTYGDASGAPCNGYAVVTVSSQSVRLEVKDSEGRTRVEHLVR